MQTPSGKRMSVSSLNYEIVTYLVKQVKSLLCTVPQFHKYYLVLFSVLKFLCFVAFKAVKIK